MNTPSPAPGITNPNPPTITGVPVSRPSPLVRGVTVIAVVVVAVIAAVVSYSHMQQLAVRVGEAWRSWLIPLSIDGLVVAASMVLVTARRTGLGGGFLAWGALGTGVAASLAANMADARPHVTAVLVAGWPAVAFAVTFELLLQQRRAEQREATTPPPGAVAAPSPGLHQPVAPPTHPAPPTVPARAMSPVVAAPMDPVEERLHALMKRTGRRPGRRVLARELGISEHHARTVLERVSAPSSPQASLTGGGGPRP
jgi:Protein of unknown function (DUF2637)